MSDTFNFEAAAANLFGATTPTSQPTAPSNSSHGVDDALAGRMFPNQRQTTPVKAPDVSHEPTTDEADKMFNSGNPGLYHGDAMRGIEQAAMERMLASPEEASEASSYWGSVFQEAGLTGTESAQIADIGISAFTQPATPELRTSWVEQSQQALVQDYGPQGARAALDDARRFVDVYGTRELRDVLDSTGLGDHPAIIRIIAQKARAARNAGKL
jgi:hypothetical protein